MVITPRSVLVFYLQNLLFSEFLFAVLKISHRLTVDGEINSQYRRFNAAGTQLSVRCRRDSAFSAVIPSTT
jgi:hypothetical protein